MSAIYLQGRWLSELDLKTIVDLRNRFPDWTRNRISIYLAELWDWRNEAGQLKDMAARTLLLKLQARGLIELPPPRRNDTNRLRKARPATPLLADLFEPHPLTGPISQLMPVSLQLVESGAQRQHVRELLQRYHYCGFSGAVGENVQYLAKDTQNRELAVMVFGAAAWKMAPRDNYIGWSSDQRRERLRYLANQQRFLILPWVKVPHLASHLLALATRRLSADWQRRYGHPIWLVESFVEDQRFPGVSYRAAGWSYGGKTTGRTRQDRHHTLQTPIKSVWLKPLSQRFKNHLRS